MFLSFFALSYANIFSELPKFPSYSQSMDLGVDCTASCWLNSCSGAGTCSCACGFWSCNCKPSNPKEQSPMAENYITQRVKIEDISVSEEQYKRTKDFAMFLKALDSKETDKAYTYLVGMINYLKDRNNDGFNEMRTKFLSNLNDLDNLKKNEINKYFEKVGAKERI